MRSAQRCRSRRTAGSAFSWTTRDALVCWRKTLQRPVRTPARETARRTSPVTSCSPRPRAGRSISSWWTFTRRRLHPLPHLAVRRGALRLAQAVVRDAEFRVLEPGSRQAGDLSLCHVFLLVARGGAGRAPGAAGRHRERRRLRHPPRRGERRGGGEGDRRSEEAARARPAGDGPRARRRRLSVGPLGDTIPMVSPPRLLQDAEAASWAKGVSPGPASTTSTPSSTYDSRSSESHRSPGRILWKRTAQLSPS